MLEPSRWNVADLSGEESSAASFFLGASELSRSKASSGAEEESVDAAGKKGEKMKRPADEKKEKAAKVAKKDVNQEKYNSKHLNCFNIVLVTNFQITDLSNLPVPVKVDSTPTSSVQESTFLDTAQIEPQTLSEQADVLEEQRCSRLSKFRIFFLIHRKLHFQSFCGSSIVSEINRR